MCATCGKKRKNKIQAKPKATATQRAKAQTATAKPVVNTTTTAVNTPAAQVGAEAIEAPMVTTVVGSELLQRELSPDAPRPYVDVAQINQTLRVQARKQLKASRRMYGNGVKLKMTIDGKAV